MHDAPLPPWPGRRLDEIASRLDGECEWLVTNGVLPTDLVTRNRQVAEAALRPWKLVFIHGDLQITHVFVDGDEITGVIDWSEAAQGDALYACGEHLHGQQVFRRRRRDPQARMIEDARSCSVAAGSDVGTRRLVEPPLRQAELVGDCSGLVEHDPVRLEHGIDVTSRPPCVVGQGPRSPTEDVQIRDHTPQRPRLDPRRRTAPVLGRQMLRQCCEEYVSQCSSPVGRWFLVEQNSAHLGRFPAVLLQELRHQPPPTATNRHRRVSSAPTSRAPRQATVSGSYLAARFLTPLTLVHREVDSRPATARKEHPASRHGSRRAGPHGRSTRWARGITVRTRYASSSATHIGCVRRGQSARIGSDDGRSADWREDCPRASLPTGGA
ncbi:phosphotransferase [Micromonospora sp. NPDC047707]|uniref:phosphotransferase n=1 Tax=Micromonospora sp. NPDC047707 TaxID=3154498 RepID=UPI003454A968